MAAGAEQPSSGVLATLRRPLSPALLGGIAAVVLVALAVGLMMPSLGKARSSVRGASTIARGPSPAPMAPAPNEWRDAASTAESSSVPVAADWNEVAKPAGPMAGADPPLADIMRKLPVVTADAHATGRLGAADRAVIRRATIELSTPDVRSAFLKAQHALSEAEGEYVQDSSLTGSGKTAQANLTLRVGASRLGAVLNALRELGEVKSEQQAGEDVTTQMVDLEARLRNERRVETELLQLLESRKNSPLKEILDLRSSISGVRQSIEQLAGQQERLGRLVSLASVLVIIRTGDAPAVDEVKKEGMWGYFTGAAAGAWRKGLTVLADTLAVIVSIVIGGLVWWIIIVIGAAVIVRIRRRAAGKPAGA